MIRSMLSTKKNTVASVLVAFNNALDDLKKVEIEQEAEATRQAQIIIDAQSAHDTAISEAAMSREVQSKLTAIIIPTMPTLGTAGLAFAQ